MRAGGKLELVSHVGVGVPQDPWSDWSDCRGGDEEVVKKPVSRDSASARKIGQKVERKEGEGSR